MPPIYIHPSWENIRVVCRHQIDLIYKHLSTDNRLAAENNGGFIYKATTVGTVVCDWSSPNSRTITVFRIVSRLQRRVKSVRPDESDWLRRARFTSYNYCCSSCTFKLLTQKQNDNPGLLKIGFKTIEARVGY